MRNISLPDIILEKSIYTEILRESSSNKLNVNIPNDDFFHSSAVYERFFLDAEEEVFIVARGIKDEIFNRINVINSAQRFLKKTNTKIEMILSAGSFYDILKAEESIFLNELQAYREKIFLTFIALDPKPDNIKNWLDNTASFTTADSRMIRFRHIQKSNDSYSRNSKAEVNFNNPLKVHQEKTRIISKINKDNLIATESLIFKDII